MIKHYSALSENGIASMATTPDSKYLFAGSDTGNLQQICVESQEVVHDYGKIHYDCISNMQTTTDSKYVIIVSLDKHIMRVSIENRVPS
jgi:hypothetical protein